MNAEIICIGTELLLGHTVDTNSAYLARELAELGINLFHKSTVGDNLNRIVSLLRQAWNRSDVLILSGGLGPTQDDLTREAVAELLGEPLEFREEAWEEILSYFRKTGRSLPESNRRQAMFPASARMLSNRLGTAPGLFVECNGKYLFAFPGVPRELIGLWEEHGRPFLKRLLSETGHPVLTSKMIRMIGIGESAMEERVMDLIQNQTNPTIAPYVGKGDVLLRITARGNSEAENHRRIDEMYHRVQERLGEYIYGTDEETLEEVIGRQLTAKGWTLATAESCTGGLIGHRLTLVPGSSAYYLGGVVSYSNRLKTDLLQVPESILQEYGAVSEETARAMAEGVRLITGADVGIGVTGIAGPDGGTEMKPVGLVYYSVALSDKTVVEHRIFPYDRSGNKEAAAQAVLTLLWKMLR
ncbi:MAG TPA: competence/damage-inducible protein A [Bacillota bacterium]|nr:competence/damage-inducible protein A [Bacillota bacterium]